MCNSLIHQRKIQIILRFIVDFLKSNPIHCTSYLAKTSIHWFELLLWSLVLLLFLIGGLLSSFDLIADYTSRNSAITSNIDYVEFKTLFPSLTLCPHYTLNQTKVSHYIKKFIDEKGYNSTSLKALMLEEFLQNLSKTNIKKTYHHKSFNTINPEEYMHLIFNLSNNYDVILSGETAVKIMTEIGVCYTINNFLHDTLYTKYWGDSKPYPENLGKHYKPENKYFSFNNIFPLQTFVKHNIMENTTVYIDSPYELPTIGTRSALVIEGNSNFTNTLDIAVQEITFDEMFLKEVSVESRHCRSITESNLKLFPTTYSHNLCMMECRAEFVRELCNCVPHFYLNENWKNANVCNIQGLNCFHKHNEKFRRADTRCKHCQPNCRQHIVVVNNLRNKGKNNTSKIFFRLKYPPLQSYVRSVMYSNLDYIVSLSGVLSSYFGFSVFSLCYVIYFFTVRIYWFRKGFTGSIDELIL